MMEMGFEMYTTANQKEELQIFWLQFWRAVMSSIVVQSISGISMPIPYQRLFITAELLLIGVWFDAVSQNLSGKS